VCPFPSRLLEDLQVAPRQSSFPATGVGMLFFLPRFHRPVNRLFTRPEVTHDLLERADTYLDVIQLSKSGTWIQFAALSKKTAHGVKSWLAFFSTKLVE